MQKQTKKEAKYALKNEKWQNKLLVFEMAKTCHNMQNKDIGFGIRVVQNAWIPKGMSFGL